MALPSQFVKGPSTVLWSIKTGLGAGSTFKVPVLVTGPLGVVMVTVIVPLVTWSESVAVILVALFTVKLTALVLPNCTWVAPVKFVPVMVSGRPWQTGLGEKDVMVGACAQAMFVISKKYIL